MPPEEVFKIDGRYAPFPGDVDRSQISLLDPRPHRSLTRLQEISEVPHGKKLAAQHLLAFG